MLASRQNITKPIVVATILQLAGACGCQDSSLPSTAGVQLPDGSVLRAAIHTGPASLGGATWACYRAATDEFIVRAEFDAEGRLVRFRDNAIYFPDILGHELIPDGRPHPTITPVLTYAAAGYGGENISGFGFEAQLVVWFAGIKVGSGVAYAYGVVNDDRLHGTFGYVTDVMPIPGSPFLQGGQDEYEFYAARE